MDKKLVQFRVEKDLAERYENCRLRINISRGGRNTEHALMFSWIVRLIEREVAEKGDAAFTQMYGVD